MKDCKEVLKHLSEYLDEDLSPELVERMAAHLNTCGDCEEAKRKLLHSIEICRELQINEQPRQLPESVRNDLRSAYLKVRANLPR